MSNDEINRAKQAVREHVWDLLERSGAAPKGVRGHIPDFVDAEEAAARLAEHDAWKAARVIKSNPDRAQLSVRLRALNEDKLVYMAVPRLATPKPFYLLDPARLKTLFEEAATSSSAAGIAPHISIEEMRPVDLVVCGSVAVNRQGVRIGKGAGYADIEVALLTEAGLIGPQTTIVTTVHPLQLVDDDLPKADHDFSVDLIITPTEIIKCEPSKRPGGVLRDHLAEDHISAIPALGAWMTRTARQN
jgi:5-formyltetrahydrofolate cyclo-ligase